MKGTYRRGRVSGRMVVGAEKSRQTNRTAPFREIVGKTIDPGGYEHGRELLECGHVGSYATQSGFVAIGRRRRCKECRNAA